MCARHRLIVQLQRGSLLVGLIIHGLDTLQFQQRGVHFSANQLALASPQLEALPHTARPLSGPVRRHHDFQAESVTKASLPPSP